MTAPTAPEARCEPFREAVSARLDGEDGPVAAAVLEAHLGDCAACREYADQVAELARRLRLEVAPAVPDLATEILTAVPVRTPLARRLQQWRGVLALTAVAQLLLAVPTLVTAGGLHTSREAAIFQVALAVGFLVVARRPAHAAGLLPVAAAVTVLAVLASVADIAGGLATIASESAHLLEVVGALALWALARRTGGALSPRTT